MGLQLAKLAAAALVVIAVQGCGCGQKKDYEKVRAKIPGLAQREHANVGKMNPHASVPKTAKNGSE